METRLAWYLVSSASFVIPLGVGQLLLPWLLAIYLEESATRIGLAQMIAQLPVVMLVLWGGWLGDRMDQRRLLIYLTGIIAADRELPFVSAMHFRRTEREGETLKTSRNNYGCVLPG